MDLPYWPVPVTPQDKEKVTVLAGGKTGIVSPVDMKVAAETGLGQTAVPVAAHIKALHDRPADG